MENKGCTTIPRILFEIITFLTKALPIRSIPVFSELLVGAMITQAGFVTKAWLAINPVRTWNSYYKWLEKGTMLWDISSARQQNKSTCLCKGTMLGYNGLVNYNKDKAFGDFPVIQTDKSCRQQE